MLYSILIAGMFTFVCEKEGGRGGEGRERNNGVSGMHDRTDGRTALREIALHASDGIVPLSNSLLSSASFSVRSSVVPRPRVRAPMSSFLPTYDRQPATCPCVSCPPVLCPFLLHPFAKHPTLHASARGRVATLVPGERVANRRPNGISRERMGAQRRWIDRVAVCSV